MGGCVEWLYRCSIGCLAAPRDGKLGNSKLGITMGDPAGVGPEIICKALASLTPRQRARHWVFGNKDILRRADQLCGTGLFFFTEPTEESPGAVRVVHTASPGIESVEPGEASAAGGAAAHAYVAAAVRAALQGDIGVIVTAPLNKAALHAAGHPYSGHTELLAHLSGQKSSFMLLTSDKLSTVHVSTHVSLAGAVQRATTARVLDTIKAGNAHFQAMGMPRPRIAVAGLNPHCGEGGLFGTEDAEQIEPAIRAARQLDIDVRGPIPGDSVFHRALSGEFDLVVAQYHDQGHIPTKLVAFDTTVNVTLGLPIARTSVDHGTAYDIAWKSTAKHQNMLAAMAYARRIADGPETDTQEETTQ
jgi:4-hydroxythreonine-4-phosphate dehydrogenase